MQLMMSKYVFVLSRLDKKMAQVFFIVYIPYTERTQHVKKNVVNRDSLKHDEVSEKESTIVNIEPDTVESLGLYSLTFFSICYYNLILRQFRFAIWGCTCSIHKDTLSGENLWGEIVGRNVRHQTKSSLLSSDEKCCPIKVKVSLFEVQLCN